MKYKSRYSPQKLVTAAQFITELICEKKASLSGVELPIFFWKLPEWEKFYKSQIFTAHKLLKQYDERAIIAAIRLPAAKRQYSLRSFKLADLFKSEQTKLELSLIELEKAAKNTIETNESKDKYVVEVPRLPMPQPKSNIMNKLRNI